ncbi:MAG: response regulator [Streptosporangiaceae bacterium]|jgi:LmbE family N-acetylglucosaminyl deacetylase|nr:hypothetical protein [Actinomycetota bacterium]
MTNAERPASRGRILLAEDDADAAHFVARVLAGRAGFEVVHEADPAAALRRAATEHWDAVLTDVEMPGMTGIELLESLRREAPSLPVAVITAHVSVDNALGALRGRADDFLEKPLHPDQLIASVTALVDRRRAARQLVLAVGAHPDDVEIGAAGALAAHRALGHDIAILTLSRGARGGADHRRAAEAQEAARILGATLYLDDLEDTRISEGDPTISAVSRVIGAVRPAVVYTHSIHDVHQDHRNTHRAVMVAAREIGRVFCFQSPSATVDFRPARYVSIDAQLQAKLAAIDAFASQVEVRAYLEPDLIEATARYWSRFAEGRYAEAFEVIRDRGATPVPGAPPAAAVTHSQAEEAAHAIG